MQFEEGIEWCRNLIKSIAVCDSRWLSLAERMHGNFVIPMALQHTGGCSVPNSSSNSVEIGNLPCVTHELGPSIAEKQGMGLFYENFNANILIYCIRNRVSLNFSAKWSFIGVFHSVPRKSLKFVLNRDYASGIVVHEGRLGKRQNNLQIIQGTSQQSWISLSPSLWLQPRRSRSV